MAEHSTQLNFAKRASRACLYCRVRKTRCNIEKQGQPCGNCLTDEVDCQLAQSRRGRKRRQRVKNDPKGPRPTHNEIRAAEHINAKVGGSGVVVRLGRISPTHTTGWLDDDAEVEMLTQSHDEGISPIRPAADLDQLCLHQELTYTSLVGQDLLPYNIITTPTSLASPRAISPLRTSPSANSSGTNESLPNFISPLSHIITPEDIDYLRLKGALDIPSRNFLTAALSAYIQYVYPYMPATDLSRIRGTLAGEDASISILLLQAIAFAAIPFVDMDEIGGAGFDSRRACRKAFYNKAKLLYDLDVESDKLTVIQATLLIAYWGETPGDNKGAWHWMGVAISLAQLLGMHRKAEYQVQSHERRLYKRVWWSCYIRDRLLAIAMCRPLRIKDAEFNTPPLVLEDFDIIDVSTGTGELFPDVENQTALAEMCIKMTELCKMVAGVLDLHFSIFPNEDSTTARDNGTRAAMLYLKSSSRNEQAMQEYDEQIQTWYRTLPSSCLYRTTTAHEKPSCVIVNAASLHITFWAVVSALHRPQLRSKADTVSLKRVEEAAIEISRVDREMHRICLDRYLPSTAGISLQFPVFITNTKLLQNKKTGAMPILESLFFCTKVVETLRESFIGGDDAISFFTLVARQANVTLLFNNDSELYGIEYQGVHYSPGSLGSEAVAGFGDACLSEMAFDTDQPLAGKVNQSLELPSFDNFLGDWAGLSGMPAFDVEFEQCFGTLINWDYLPDVELG